MRVRTAATASDPAQRDALVMAHVDLVRSIASRLGRRLPGRCNQPLIARLILRGVTLRTTSSESKFLPELESSRALPLHKEG